MERKKVVRVTLIEFELEDGTVMPHAVELEEVPTLEEFQEYYDNWYTVLEGMTSGEPPDNQTSIRKT